MTDKIEPTKKTNKKNPTIVSVKGLLELPQEEQDRIINEMINRVDALFGVTPTPKTPGKKSLPQKRIRQSRGS
jgi:hypothetical protein